MRARKYNKRIEVWQTANVSDGYGGNTVTTSLVNNSWCKLITNEKANYRDTDFGETETYDRLIIQLRKRKDLVYNSKTNFFKYRGVDYSMISDPINIGFEDREIQITLTRIL